MAPLSTKKAINEVEWQLIILSPGDPRVEYQLCENVTNIGRQKNNEVILKDNTVSRLHAQIKYDQETDTLSIKDMDSTNGIFVNSIQIHEEHALRPGDRIRIGIYLLIFAEKPKKTANLGTVYYLDRTDLSNELLIRSIDQFAILFHKLSSELAVTQTLEKSIVIITNFLRNMLGVHICGVVFPKEIDKFIQQYGYKKSVNYAIDNRLSLIESTEQKKAVFKSIALSPVVVDGEVVAVLYAFSDEESAKTLEEFDLQLMVGIGYHTALVIQRHRYEKIILYSSNYDVVTGLPNRKLLLECINHALARNKRQSDYGFALFFVDIDNFKLVNDSLGHVVGDKLLKEIGERLKKNFRENDFVSRYGGDEFVIVYEHVNNIREALPVINRFIENMKKPFVLEDKKIVISISIGIALSAMGYENAEDIIRDADIAMYKSKKSDYESFSVYDQNMHTELSDLLLLQSELMEAQKREEFELYYQPIVDLSTGRIEGLEALIRWNSSKYGLYLPDEFLAQIENAELLNSIECWVLSTACKQAAILNQQLDGDTPLRIAINFSGKHLKHPCVLEEINRVMEENHLIPGQIMIEIPEKECFENDNRIFHTLEAIKEMGIELLLDDFGTGYSSLSYLHQLPVKTLKIDKSFISQIGSESEKVKIVQAILALAKSLGLRTVAEGIETKEQLEFIRSGECNFAQGYFFAKPMRFEEVVSLVKRQRGYFE